MSAFHKQKKSTEDTVCLEFRRVLFSSQAEDGIRDHCVTGVQTCALPISSRRRHTRSLCDWSSDVCSSDLPEKRFEKDRKGPRHGLRHGRLYSLSLAANDLWIDRKSTRLNSSHTVISYAVFCLKKKKNK